MEILPPGYASCISVVVRTRQTAQKSHAGDGYVAPVVGAVEGYRVAVPAVEPADRSCAHAAEDRAVCMSRPEQGVDTKPPPSAHHLERVSTTDVDDVGPGELFGYGLRRWRSAKQVEHIGVAPVALSIRSVECFPLLDRIAACRRDEQGFGFDDPDSLMISTSMGRVARVLMSPPPIATMLPIT